jgi:hypothetical protein
MAPMYSPAIRRPQRGDIEQAVKRYGPPKKPAETPAAPARPADDSGWIDLGFVKLRSPSRGGGDLEVKL